MLSVFGYLGEAFLALLCGYCVYANVLAFDRGHVHVYGKEARWKTEPLAFGLIVVARFYVAYLIARYFYAQYAT